MNYFRLFWWIYIRIGGKSKGNQLQADVCRLPKNGVLNLSVIYLETVYCFMGIIHIKRLKLEKHLPTYTRKVL